MKTRTFNSISASITVAFNEANAAEPVDILIYDDIGKDPWSGDGFTAKDLKAALDEVPRNRELNIRVNSRGGDVAEGKAIRSLLSDWPGRIVNTIDGVAASTASWMVPADEVRARAHAQMFVHNSWAIVMGNAKDMQSAITMLQTTDDQIADIYANKTKRSVSEMKALMDSETLLTAQAAKDMGLVDTIIEERAIHNFSETEMSNMRSKLAALNSVRISKPADAGADGVASDSANKTNKESKNTMPANNTAEAQTPADLTPIITNLHTAIEGLTAEVKNLKAAPPGVEPINTPRVENLGNPIVEKFNALDRNDHIARARFVQANHLDLRTQMVKHTSPQNANTVDSNLVNTLIAGDFLTTMRTKLAPLGAFSHQVMVSPLSARQVLNVNLLSSAGATQDNPTNFETGDTTSTAKPVTLAHVNRSFYASNAESDLGLSLAQKAPTNALIMAEGIMAKVTALMTNANFGADVVIGAAANFDATDLPAILALAKNYDKATLLLDGGHLAYLLPTTRESFAFGEPGAFGFDGGIYKNNLWTSAATDICGLVCGPDAIIWGAGPCAAGPNGAALQTSSVTLPGVGITVQVNTWYSLASRAMWASYDVCFGAAVGDATQAEVLTTQ